MRPKPEDLKAHTDSIHALYRWKTKDRGHLVYVPSMGVWLHIYMVTFATTYQHILLIEAEDHRPGECYSTRLITREELFAGHRNVYNQLVGNNIIDLTLESP